MFWITIQAIEILYALQQKSFRGRALRKYNKAKKNKKSVKLKSQKGMIHQMHISLVNRKIGPQQKPA